MTANERTTEFLNCLAASSRQIYAFIVSLLPRSGEAEEIFQEVYRTLWEKFDDFESGTNFTAWACRIAYLKVLEARHQERRSPLLFSDLYLSVVEAEFTKKSDSLNERSQALEQCLEKLSSRDRELIARRYQSDSLPAKIAQEFKCSTSAIHKALRRIHRALFECIERTMRVEDRS